MPKTRKPLFRSVIRRTGKLTGLPLSRANAFHMIQRRAKTAGIKARIGCHILRATGIPIYLSIDKAQVMAAHGSPRTTKLYDRTSEAGSLDEVEGVVF